jgi:hypothetical protein
MVVHLVPAISLDGVARIDLLEAPEKRVFKEMTPYFDANGWKWIHDGDSITSVGVPHDEGALGYKQLFRSGALEYVAVMLGRDSGPQLNSVARMAIKALAEIVPAVEKLGLQGRCFMALDILRTKGGRIVPNDSRLLPNEKGRTITQDTLSPPHAIAESVNSDHASLLKPAFDWIWRTAGFEKCFDYDDNGRLRT